MRVVPVRLRAALEPLGQQLAEHGGQRQVMSIASLQLEKLRPRHCAATRWLGTATRRDAPSMAMSRISFSAADNPECSAVTP